MDRLTTPWNGLVVCNADAATCKTNNPSPKYDADCCCDCPRQQDIYNRLATYEDIGSIKEFIALVQADTAQGWISVKDRLPEPGEYLTWNGRQTEINTFGHRGGWMLLADPTHWMPLPEPPREEM